MKRRHANNRGFTLVEIMIVAALIAILSSIAIFSINEFFNIQVRKATIGELRQFATALSFAHDDLTFFPRFHNLNKPRALVLYDQQSDQSSAANLIPAIDYYGFIPGVPQGSTPFQSRVSANWSGPYIGLSEARQRANRGGRSGLARVRLPEVWAALSGPNREKYSYIEDYPADAYGQPYVFIQLRANVDPAGNLIPQFVTNPTQEGDYLNAVVSYGKNRFPGGNEKTAGDYLTGAGPAGELQDGAMYVLGDQLGTRGGATECFTLKTANTTLGLAANLVLDNGDPNSLLPVLNTLYVFSGYDIDTGWTGMLQAGTDDLIIKF